MLFIFLPFLNICRFRLQTVQVLANVPGGAAGERPAVQCLASVPGELPGESPAVQGLANIPGELPGESPAVQVLANICRDSRRVFKKVKTLQVSTFLNTLLPFFTGASPRTPSLTCDAARAGVAASL